MVFPAGVTVREFGVLVLDDSLAEDDERFTVTLSAPENAVLPDPPTATVTIEDDDEPVVAFSGDANAFEGDDVTFTVTLSSASEREVRVDYATEIRERPSGDVHPAGADDFEETSGRLVFAVGETSQTFSVPTVDDELPEKLAIDFEEGKLRRASE